MSCLSPLSLPTHHTLLFMKCFFPWVLIFLCLSLSFHTPGEKNLITCSRLPVSLFDHVSYSLLIVTSALPTDHNCLASKEIIRRLTRAKYEMDWSNSVRWETRAAQYAGLAEPNYSTSGALEDCVLGHDCSTSRPERHNSQEMSEAGSAQLIPSLQICREQLLYVSISIVTQATAPNGTTKFEREERRHH